MDNFKELQGGITGCAGMKGSEQTLKEVTRDKREERGIQEKKRGQKGCEQGVEYMEK